MKSMFLVVLCITTVSCYTLYYNELLNNLYTEVFDPKDRLEINLIEIFGSIEASSEVI